MTTRVDDGIPVFVDPENADTVLSALCHGRDEGRYHLLGFVTMPDHMHVVLHPRGEETISSVMQSIKGYTNWQINKRLKKKGKVLQSGFYDYALETEEKILRRVEYMHDNPVRQGLVEDASSYRYSSAYPGNGTDLGLSL